MNKTNLVTPLLSFFGKIMTKGKKKDQTVVETDHYEIPLDFYLKCEYIAAQLEITVDYLLDEFYSDGELIVPEHVEV